MQEPQAFCRAVMHEYERQWARATGHGVRHPLRVKMENLQAWCDQSCSAADFEARLLEAERSDDQGLALLAQDLLSMWRAVAQRGGLPMSPD
jgi:hypothetical protein